MPELSQVKAVTIITLVFAGVVGVVCAILGTSSGPQSPQLVLNTQGLNIQKDLRQQIRQHIDALAGDDAVAAEEAARALVAMTDTPGEAQRIRTLSQGLMAELTDALSHGTAHPQEAVRDLCSQALAALTGAPTAGGERVLPDS
jgi:outer membrane murein-binding lipoprotein Lpp